MSSGIFQFVSYMLLDVLYIVMISLFSFVEYTAASVCLSTRLADGIFSECLQVENMLYIGRGLDLHIHKEVYLFHSHHSKDIGTLACGERTCYRQRYFGLLK